MITNAFAFLISVVFFSIDIFTFLHKIGIILCMPLSTSIYFVLFLLFQLSILHHKHFPMPFRILQKHDLVWLHSSSFSGSSLP